MRSLANIKCFAVVDSGLSMIFTISGGLECTIDTIYIALK